MNHLAIATLSGLAVLSPTLGWAQANVTLYAKVVTNTMPDGVKVPMWGFSTTAGGPAQVPGPVINVPAAQVANGLVVTINNQLPEPISLVIPGLNGSTNVGQPVRFGATDPNYPDRIRSMVQEVPPGGSAGYRWNGPLKLGTYVYHSGSHPAVQVQMGLFGMVTVRSNSNQVYPGVAVAANREVPVTFSEIDPQLHWAVHTNDYGPGKTLSSTIRSKASYYLINGQAYSQAVPPPNLGGAGAVGQASLFRMINFCWDSRIPVLGGPAPSGGGTYVSVIAEDGNVYPFPKTTYAPALPALKTMDVLFTPTLAGNGNNSYRLYDRRLGLSNGTEPYGGMFRRWNVN